MPFIVTAPCIDCRHTTCVDVCPMDCFVAGGDGRVRRGIGRASTGVKGGEIDTSRAPASCSSAAL